MKKVRNIKNILISYFEKEINLNKLILPFEEHNKEINIYIKEINDYILCINFTSLTSYINENRYIDSYFGSRGIKCNIINIFVVDDLENVKNTYFQSELYEEAIFINQKSGEIECFNVHSVGFLNIIKNVVEKSYTRFFSRGKNNHLTMFIILISIIIYFIIGNINGNIVSIRDEVLLWAGGKIDPYIRDGEYMRIFISPFLHKNFLQLLVGVITLFFAGSIVEKNISKVNYIILIICGIFFGNFSSYLLNFSKVFGVGLYVINYCLIGALFILAFKYKSRVNRLFFVFIFSFIVLNLLNSVFLSNNIDNIGSLASFIVGLVFMKGIDLINR
ncbi:rhomboid family intramembrane serine protease [Candidatus Arthromitus sp. SFB-rat-Yit]|uniref:rhomboid family intramembrane serine protease n=1 Tax=Candidatus Arthromitus sp. SFB-rat-Yit TaxID=1041504 RepID=UPI000227A268|nr:rhomboid family intramembrane serine protease [Candidatus Arthromitus sp. SFB-rat-Yit]BAK80790.1 rhomboid family protein [Candidatus Arthromitus sp. SFB-rat-Yit]